MIILSDTQLAGLVPTGRQKWTTTADSTNYHPADYPDTYPGTYPADHQGPGPFVVTLTLGTTGNSYADGSPVADDLDIRPSDIPYRPPAEYWATPREPPAPHFWVRRSKVRARAAGIGTRNFRRAA